MPILASRLHAVAAIDPRLERVMRRVILCGLLAVLLLPAARGSNAWLGWLPLWLLAMPLSAWWALHRFALPRWPQAAVAGTRRRRGQAQARRRGQPLRVARQLRAA